jgi:hypothetical protein
MGNLIHNERMKLHASFFNNIAVGLFISSAVVPVLGSSFTQAIAVGLPGTILALISRHFAHKALGKLIE